jgi:hypothetical protein
MSNNTLQWTADERDPPSVSFGSLVLYRVSYMPTGTIIESRTIGHYRSLQEAKAAAQRHHDQNRDQGR